MAAFEGFDSPDPKAIPIDSKTTFRVYFGATPDMKKAFFERTRKANPLGLLVCSICGWAWLNEETADVSNFLGHWGVTCLDRNDCCRRQRVNMKGSSHA